MAAVVFRRRGERPVPTHGGDSIVVSRSDSESALATIWPPCGAAPLVRREPGRWSARREPRRLLVPASLRPAAAARQHPAVFRCAATGRQHPPVFRCVAAARRHTIVFRYAVAPRPEREKDPRARVLLSRSLLRAVT